MNIRHLIESEDVDDATGMLDRMTAPVSLNRVFDLLDKQGFHPEFPQKEPNFWLIRCIGHPDDIKKFLIQNHVHGALCYWMNDQYPGQRWNRTSVTFQRGQAYWDKKMRYSNGQTFNIRMEGDEDLDLDRYVQAIPWTLDSYLRARGFNEHNDKKWPLDQQITTGHERHPNTYDTVVLTVQQSAEVCREANTVATYLRWEVWGNMRGQLYEFHIPCTTFEQSLKALDRVLPPMFALGQAARHYPYTNAMEYQRWFERLKEFVTARAVCDAYHILPDAFDESKAQQTVRALLD